MTDLFGPKTEQDNFRIEIPIPGRDLLGNDLEGTVIQRKARLLIAEIKRHIDLPAGAPYLAADSHEKCPLCGLDWEVATYADAKISEDDPPLLKGEPVCCTAAQDAWRASRKAPTND